jgi:hypothetical protein
MSETSPIKFEVLWAMYNKATFRNSLKDTVKVEQSRNHFQDYERFFFHPAMKF